MALEYLKGEKKVDGDVYSSKKNTFCVSIPKEKILEKEINSHKGKISKKVKIYSLHRVDYEKIRNFKTQHPIKSLSDLAMEGSIEFLKGIGLNKSEISLSGKHKCIHYGELYTKYHGSSIKSIQSYTDKDGKILSKEGDVLIPASTTADKMGIAIAKSINEGNIVLGNDINVIRTLNDKINGNYLSFVINYLLKKQLSRFGRGGTVIHLKNEDIQNLKIPLLPKEQQDDIVNDIQKIEDLLIPLQAYINNYNYFLDIDRSWELKKIADIVEEFDTGKRDKGGKKSEGIPSIGGTEIDKNGFVKGPDELNAFISEELYNSMTKGVLKENDILLIKDGAGAGRVGMFRGEYDKAAVNEHVFRIRANENIIKQEILYHIMNSMFFKNQIRRFFKGQIGAIGLKIKEMEIPIPTLDIQNTILEDIKNSDNIRNSINNLINRYNNNIMSILKDSVEEL
jgi:restriction endonuclease S subunit